MQVLSAAFVTRWFAALGIAVLAAAPFPASATSCVVNGNNQWSSCTCKPNEDPNCSKEWCDGTVTENKGALTCTFTTPKPRGDQNKANGGFGAMVAPGGGVRPAQPGLKSAPATGAPGTGTPGAKPAAKAG
jgi:hypothetical protein